MSATILQPPPRAWRRAPIHERSVATHMLNLSPKIEKPRGLPWGTIIAATVCGICLLALAWSWARWLL